MYAAVVYLVELIANATLQVLLTCERAQVSLSLI